MTRLRLPTALRLRKVSAGMAVATIAATMAFSATPADVKADASMANWGQQSPAQSPAGRAYATMAYDSRRGRTVLFGGANGSTNFTDTWEWDGSSWSTFSTTVSPPSAIGPGMAYDSARGVTVLLDNNGNTWEWDGSQWTRRSTATSPPPRVWTSLAYDSAHGRMVLFGGDGTGGVDLGDTWTYDGI